MPNTGAQQKTKPYACSYFHDRSQWSLTIHAYSWEDAEARCRKLGLTLDGELISTLPVHLGFLARIMCIFGNLGRMVFGIKKEPKVVQSSSCDR